MCRAMLVHDFQSKESMFGVPRICSLSDIRVAVNASTYACPGASVSLDKS